MSSSKRERHGRKEGGGTSASANLGAASPANGQRHVTFSNVSFNSEPSEETKNLIKSAFKSAGTLFQRTQHT